MRFLFLTAILNITAAQAEAPHSVVVPPGGSNQSLPQTYPAMEPEDTAPPPASHPVVLDNQPPRFLYSASPALLVQVDGEPVLRDSGAPSLDRVINSRALLLRERTSNRYHLSLGGRWYTSGTLNGSWEPESLTATLATRLDLARQSAANLIDDPAVTGSPRIFVSTVPAELVQTNGNAALEPIGSGRLLYVTNTASDLFFHTGDQQYYLLTSGRWFRSHDLNGGWVYVSAASLPSEFSQIPPSHPKAGVLASVPGTAAAQSALAASVVPQVATVDRGTQAAAIHYDGDPAFTAIPGTQLFYARNASNPVIEVSPGRFLMVENGIWFEAPTALGPWSVTASVPPAIYNIPPSSPVYNVTYVYVYGSGPGWVRVGYLPGYLGSYATPEGVVVYGTGYHYHPWIGHEWYGYPGTFGFGVSWGGGSGWVFGAPAYHPYHPWWGPWRHEHYEHSYYAPPVHHDFYHDWGTHYVHSYTPPGHAEVSTPPSYSGPPGGWQHAGTPPGYSSAPPAYHDLKPGFPTPGGHFPGFSTPGGHSVSTPVFHGANPGYSTPGGHTVSSPVVPSPNPFSTPGSHFAPMPGGHSGTPSGGGWHSRR
ncbi:MAG: hypothetical protein ACXVB9_02710 [Bdellovibrionota bacterium]